MKITMNNPEFMPAPVRELISRALTMCEQLLTNVSVFYPFAAINTNDVICCVFAHETEEKETETKLIEKLQWRIIDTTTGTDSYSILVYAATVRTHRENNMDAIAIAISGHENDEQLLLYPYYRVGNKIVISPPINTMPN
jgi:hypothetical protein